MISRTARMAATAVSAADSAAAWLSARIKKFPPPIAFWIPNSSWTRNSPSMTGMRQYRRPSTTLLD